ncbi:hypothetical protein BA059_25780 [Mycolicibacterium sp. (ex Dasyatis americana)]|uniref:Uncharacterized protein n=1 Tax=Mycobacterium syngnathidarum TaxID=1908205 RepID=A0A1Q9WDI8_9MYCO|nr:MULTISPECIES: DUF6480 family protein [Mycobacterium]MCG7606156.1 DUF6480 family protein [Mycobacterium sp. CnD-18-1]OFB36126.1 hypothetical protein BA059_25780 [Mycolicibacterium sp. (ex Dasyatis americana)]OHU08063.1 hypothetical protein BKG61_01600 [Mycobacterium syngnathidarum]OLT96840.1 hypothetical protein BKG60_08130 [Mycobacterium syngnathidarum]
MTALPPDPDPAETPDLQPGGGVAPGATPPDSAQTSGLGEPEPRPRHKYTPTSVTAIVGLVLLIAVFVAVGVLLIMKMTGVFG